MSEERLLTELRALDGAIVAFSGGVDSSVLLHAAVAALGPARVLAVTARSPSLPATELADAERVAAEIGAPLRVVSTDELARDGYRANGADRCYFCKSELFDVVLRDVLGPLVPAGWALLYGAIADDLGDHRPGARAAAERGVRGPLAELGFTKADVRAYARRHGLSVADKPALACLASRIPYGHEVHAATLRQIERAEYALRELGFAQLRVRHHERVARIEVPAADISRIVALRDEVTARLRACGYTYVAVDLAGYRSGALNEALRP
ncbi:MAG: ATP-dependent sacrificial sulfur transferase LarE [Planctomycetes bacterium]|nr:ATP-dependent sacrificial sulfur transferase LarE [Planctomycetota bacterium]